MLGFYVVCRQWQGNCIFVFCRQWQGKQWLANTFCIFLSFVNIGQLQLFWLLYQMPYIYWWLMKNYSMTPKNMYTISQLNDRYSELLFCYMSYYYMSLFMCAGCMCCLFLQVDRLSHTLNSLSTQLSSHNALYAQTNTTLNIQQNTNNSQLTAHK